MLNYFAEKVDDGYGGFMFLPTTAGYVALIAILLLLLLAIGFIRSKKDTQAINTQQMMFSALAVGIAMVTSYMKLFKMPFGGSVTLCSMLFICLIGYWYGVKVGVMTGVAYGLLQLIIDPYILTIPQVFFDYFLAFGALGLSGLTHNKKNSLPIGYLIGVLGRLIFSCASGYIFFASYAPEGMNPLIYTILYNGAYIGAEAVISTIVLLLPPVKSALTYVKSMAENYQR